VSIKIFNMLPAFSAELVKDKKHCMLALKRFLTVESFYSCNKYLNYQHELKIDDQKGIINMAYFGCIFCLLVLI
jgi:hypothetical protein